MSDGFFILFTIFVTIKSTLLLRRARSTSGFENLPIADTGGTNSPIMRSNKDIPTSAASKAIQ